MTLNRLLGGISIAMGGLLLAYLIPANVTAAPESVMNPALFPTIAAWLLIGLGAAQVLTPIPGPELPSPRVAARVAAVAVLTFAAVLAMPHFGYLPVTVLLMAAFAWLVHERRWPWLGVIVLALPAGVWVFFELLLQRPLP